MKALVHDGKGNIALQDRERPRLRSPKDAIVRVTLSSICTSDLHILQGAVPRALPNTVLGHEFVGVVEELGADVEGFSVGDRVAVNVETFCGSCYFCERGWVNNCENGGWEIGCRIDGCQAEYVRVPFAQNGLVRIPDEVTDQSALFLGDVLATGHWSVELAEVEAGSVLAVIGAGPVGLTAMMSARLRKPACIVAIDVEEARLELALRQGLADLAVNPLVHDVEAAVRKATEGRGADAVIEAAGGADTFELAWSIARPNAVVSIPALYEEDQTLPLPRMYGKNLVFKTGGVDACRLERVMELVARGLVDTNCLVSRTYPLNDIVEAYRVFGERNGSVLKVAITPFEHGR